MRNVGKMIDLKREDEAEKVKAPDPLEYPPGMCISLDETSLKKLNLDKTPEKGDLLHFFAMARVEEVHDGRFGTHIALQITHLALESEDAENEAAAKKMRRYGDDDDAGED